MKVKFKNIVGKVVSFVTAITMFWIATSATVKYAADEFTAYAASNVILGYINNDGTIYTFDLSVFKHNLQNKKMISPNIADLNGDSVVNHKDVNELQDYLLGRTNGFTGSVKKALNAVDRSIIAKTVDGKDITASEVQMTAEMAELAETLGTPQEVYKYVLNNVNTEFYYSSRKGSIGTYEQNGGNDFDQANFLVAMLRYLGHTANYGIAKVVLTGSDLCGMTKTTNIDAAKSIFTHQGRKLENYSPGKYKTELAFGLPLQQKP